MGRTLIAVGLAIAAVGAFVTLGARLPFRLGRLPGDLVYRGGNSVVYFPLVTSLLLSVLVSFVLWLFNKR